MGHGFFILWNIAIGLVYLTVLVAAALVIWFVLVVGPDLRAFLRRELAKKTTYTP